MPAYQEIKDEYVKLQFEEVLKKQEALEDELRLLKRLINQNLRGY